MVFVTGAGVPVRYMQNGYSAQPGHRHVEVIYDPDDPVGTAVVKSFATLWLPILLPAFLGAAALTLVGASFILSWRHP